MRQPQGGRTARTRAAAVAGAVGGLTAAVLLVLSGCGSGGDARWVPPSGGSAASAAKASVSPSPATVPGTPGFPAGLVISTNAGSGNLLVVADPTTGRQRKRIALPPVDSSKLWARSSFSKDWTLVTWASEGSPMVLHVARLQGEQYVEFASWPVPGSAAKGAELIGSVFNQGNGRVLVEYALSAGGLLVYSGDPAVPATALRREQADTLRMDANGTFVTDVDVGVVGRPDWAGGVHRSPLGVVSAVINSVYECDIKIDARTLACLGPGDFGSVAVLTFDEATKKVTLRQVVPNVGTPTDLAISPDHTTLMYALRRGWFAVNLDGSGGPRTAFTALELPPGDQQPYLVCWL